MLVIEPVLPMKTKWDKESAYLNWHASKLFSRIGTKIPVSYVPEEELEVLIGQQYDLKTGKVLFTTLSFAEVE